MPSEPLVFASDSSPSASRAWLHESNATCTVQEADVRRGVGSNSTKSGRSGLSIREYHVLQSMQPMLIIQSSDNSSLTTGAGSSVAASATRAC